METLCFMLVIGLTLFMLTVYQNEKDVALLELVRVNNELKKERGQDER